MNAPLFSPTSHKDYFLCSEIKGNETPIPLLGIWGKAIKIYVYIKTCTHILITALFIITKMWKRPKSTSTDEWINKICYLHIMSYYSAIERNKVRIKAKT